MSFDAPTRTSGRPPVAACTVLLPGLDSLRARLGAAAMPWLERLLARAACAPSPAAGLHAAIALAMTGEAAGLRRWAPAAVCAAEDGIEAPGSRLARLDPVSLAPVGDRVVMGPVGAIDRGAAETLADAIDAALDGDPAIRVGAPDRWYAVLARAPNAGWTAPEDAMGNDLYEALPDGPGGKALRRLVSEVEMVLHEHPVNAARAARGLAPVNGVWAWGWSSSLDESPPWPGLCWGDHPYARGLARRGGGECAPGDAPAPAGDWPAPGLKVCDAPWRALLAGDDAAAARQLARFDRAWAEPLLRALQRRRLEALAVIADGVEYTLRPAGAWRVWRRRMRQSGAV